MFDYIEVYLISIIKYRFVIYFIKIIRFGNLYSENNVGKYIKLNIIISFIEFILYSFYYKGR